MAGRFEVENPLVILPGAVQFWDVRRHYAIMDDITRALSLMQRISDRLVERGYATRHILDINQGFGQFEWTPKGEMLHKEVCHFFDVPNKRPDEIPQEEMFVLVWILLMTRDA